MKLETLYKRNKNGTIAYAEVYTRKVRNKNEYYLFTKKGKLNGDKPMVTKRHIKSSRYKTKTVLDVTLQKANKLFKDLKTKGYSTDLISVKSSKNNTFNDGGFMPMLLNKINLSKIKYPCFIQRKYDGIRCLTEHSKNSTKIKTRENNAINLSKILKSVTDICSKQLGYNLDGELYAHGLTVSQQVSALKNGDPNNVFKYVIYDIPVPNLNFTLRRNLLYSIDTSKYSNIEIDYGTEVKNQKELVDFYEKALSDGYEGAVICDANGTYDFGYRTSSKSKFKPRETDEFLCVDHYFNKGKMAKQSTLICKTKDGSRTFHVKMKGTSEQREKWAAEFKEKFLNKYVTVEYRKLSEYDVPIEAVGLAVRDYE